MDVLTGRQEAILRKRQAQEALIQESQPKPEEKKPKKTTKK